MFCAIFILRGVMVAIESSPNTFDVTLNTAFIFCRLGPRCTVQPLATTCRWSSFSSAMGLAYLQRRPVTRIWPRTNATKTRMGSNCPLNICPLNLSSKCPLNIYLNISKYLNIELSSKYLSGINIFQYEIQSEI